MRGRETRILEALRNQRLQVLKAVGAGDVDLGAEFCHLHLDGVEPGRIGVLLEQAVAVAHGLLVVADRGRVRGDQRRHQTVQKPPAIGGGAGEQPVHGWGQPQHPQIVAQQFHRPGIGAVDAHAPPTFGRRAGAEIGGAVIGLDRCRYRPGLIAALLLQRVEAGIPQATAGGEHRYGFQQIGLAGAVGAGQHHMALVEIERRRSIVAKGGEAQAGKMAGHVDAAARTGIAAVLTRASASARRAPALHPLPSPVSASRHR